MKGWRMPGRNGRADIRALITLAVSLILSGTALPAPPDVFSPRPRPHAAIAVPGVMKHGLRTRRELALTFDACSSRGRGRLDTAVAGVLFRTRTPATIFLGGKWAKDVGHGLRPLCADSLLEFGNHAYMHPHLEKFSDDSIRQELRKAQRAIRKVVGRSPLLFRAPYGEVDARVAAVAESLGLTVIEYDLPSGDPDSSISEKALVRYVVSMARAGSIIVMHINTRGWHTAAALPGIIAGLRRRGFTFVKVSRLVAEAKMHESPPAGRTGTPR